MHSQNAFIQTTISSLQKLWPGAVRRIVLPILPVCRMDRLHNWVHRSHEYSGQERPALEISDAQRFAKAAHESRQIKSSEAHQRWKLRTIDWNVDTIALGFMDPRNLQAIIAEIERIGIKSIELIFATHRPSSSPLSSSSRDDNCIAVRWALFTAFFPGNISEASGGRE